MAALGLLVGPIIAEAQHVYQQIDYPGQAQTNIWGINDCGDAVGVGFDPDTIPFIYASMDGATIDVAPAPGFLSTSLLGINDAGVMVGAVALFQVNGQRTVARGINDAGFVAGNVLDQFTGELRGFVIKAPETNCASIDVDPADLMQFLGSFQLFPEGITNSGDVVGIFFDASGAAHGFIATEQ